MNLLVIYTVGVTLSLCRRSPILVPIESSYTTSYQWLILTYMYLLSCTVCEIWPSKYQDFKLVA